MTGARQSGNLLPSTKGEIMSIYVVATVKVLDPSAMEDYSAIAGPLVGQYGGEYVAATSGEPEVVEGEWVMDAQTVVIKFPSREKFYAFWNSPEYEEAKKIRKGKAILNNVILDEMTG
jgi:uncharacterized protein (DUF1330 family)